MPDEWELARIIHEARIAFCWGPGAVGKRDKWPSKRPGDFGYQPQPWSDIALAQARAVLKQTGPGED